MLQVELFNDNLQGEYVITLKEITDLIGVRHNDAMRKVEDLSLEYGFGTLREIRIVYNDKGQEIDTYIFTKKQAIAVGARLNTTMLMKVINRLEELELNKQFKLPQTFSEALRLLADETEAKEQLQLQLIAQKPKVDFYEAVTGSKDTIDIGTVSKVLNISGLGRTRLFSFLRENGILMSNNAPYQTYCDRGYFRVIESKFTKPDGSTHINTKTVVYQKGVEFIRKLIIQKG
jgi:anti-repressor protein